MASYHHDWREIRKPWGFGTSWHLTFQLILIAFVKFLKVKTQRKCKTKGTCICDNNWQCFQSQGVYIIYGPVQWVTLHDILVYFKVDVVH